MLEGVLLLYYGIVQKFYDEEMIILRQDLLLFLVRYICEEKFRRDIYIYIRVGCSISYLTIYHSVAFSLVLFEWHCIL